MARLDLGRVLTGKVEAGRKGIEMAAIHLVGELKSSVDRPSIMPAKTRKKERERRLREARAANETIRVSKPGEPPRKREGTLHDNITYEMVGPTTARVGTSLDYGYWLEWGTVKMAARPWLRPGLAANAKRIKDIVVAYLRKG